MARVTDAMLESLVKNEGYINGLTEVSPTGVLRMALDLQELREEHKKVLESWEKTATDITDLVHTALRALGYWPTAENKGKCKDPAGRPISELIALELTAKDAIIEDKDHLVKALQFAVDRRGKEIDHLKALLNRPEVAEALVRSLAMEIRADVEKVAFAPDPVPPAPKKCAKKGKKKAKSRKSR